MIINFPVSRFLTIFNDPFPGRWKLLMEDWGAPHRNFCIKELVFNICKRTGIPFINKCYFIYIPNFWPNNHNMRKLLSLTIFLGSSVLFAQDLSFSKPGNNIYKELPNPAETSAEEWSKVTFDVNVSFASDNSGRGVIVTRYIRVPEHQSALRNWSKEFRIMKRSEFWRNCF